jgi:hypothetical protein
MEPFLSERDFDRALDYLSNPRALAKLSPVDRLLFHRLSDRVPVAFKFPRTLTAGEIVADAFTFKKWYENPATGQPGSESGPRFWEARERQVRRKLVDAGVVPSQGWYFWPCTIMFEFWDAPVSARKVARIAQVTQNTTRGVEAATGSRNDETILAVGMATGNNQRQIHNCHDFEADPAGTIAYIGPLFPTPLFPGTDITASGLTNLIATDIVDVTMIGEWRFQPRFVQTGDEPRG